MSRQTSNIAKRLKLLRHAAGLTQKALAHRLNISRSGLANYESGKRLPDTQMMLQIAEFFRVSREYITGEEEALPAKSVAEFCDGVLDLSVLDSVSRLSVSDYYRYLKEIKID